MGMTKKTMCCGFGGYRQTFKSGQIPIQNTQTIPYMHIQSGPLFYDHFIIQFLFIDAYFCLQSSVIEV